MIENSVDAVQFNRVTLAGKIGSIHYSHQNLSERFYNATIEIPRLSGYLDRLPLIIPASALNASNINNVDSVYLIGELRTYNKFIDNRRKLILYVYVKEIFKDDDEIAINEIILNGFICKNTVFRVTPLRRSIADILLAVNREHNKSSYIPCISWSRNATYASNLRIGDNIDIVGRIQSRIYEKLVNGISEQKLHMRFPYPL